MLQSLSIKNVAVISNINIEFGKGFNVLLGETGAGKSIIFDALNFVLGAKADKTLIRSGEKEMRVDAVFSDLSDSAQAAFSELGFDGNEIGLSRVYTLEGKSSARVNGFPVVLSVLKEIGSVLVDSYSQHESVELLKSKNHLVMLDKFGGEEILKIKAMVKERYEMLSEIKKKILQLGGDAFERERKKSLLEYQINEIEDAKVKQGEDEVLSEKLNFFNSAEKIYEAVSYCQQLLNEGNGACLSQLQQSLSALSGFGDFENIEDCRSRLESVKYEVEDIIETLDDIKSNTEFDEREFDRLDRRYDLIKSLTKKYGGSVDNMLEYLEKSKEELDELENSEENIIKLEKEKAQLENALEEDCEKLSDLRKKTAVVVKEKMKKELNELGMKSSVFDASFTKLDNLSANGIDVVEFVFSANKGQEIKSLSKTASGGELSRFMLAFKNIFNEIGGAQTLIFDEIDAGISGETGNIVGLKLNNITKNMQVICITHLPQVASFGDDFYFVSKKETLNSTSTEIKNLEGEEIVKNLARMVVGDNLTPTAIKQAEEMRGKTGKLF